MPGKMECKRRRGRPATTWLIPGLERMDQAAHGCCITSGEMAGEDHYRVDDDPPTDGGVPLGFEKL